MSVRQNFSDYDVTIINEQNLLNYINLLNIILEKYNKCIISKIHFSDIIRIELLKKYGGLWFDATIMFTGKRFVHSIVSNTQFFCYQFFLPGSICRTMDMWFLASIPEHPSLCLASDLHIEYWQKYSLQLAYHLSALFFTLIFETHNDLIAQVPRLDAHNCFLLQKALPHKMNKEYYNIIINHTEIHKLTHKFFNINDAMLILTNNNTFYSYLLGCNNFTNTDL